LTARVQSGRVVPSVTNATHEYVTLTTLQAGLRLTFSRARRGRHRFRSHHALHDWLCRLIGR
jgi:hypothetical protein